MFSFQTSFEIFMTSKNNNNDLFKEATHLGVRIFHVGPLIRKHNLQYSQHETIIYNIYNMKQNLHYNDEIT